MDELKVYERQELERPGRIYGKTEKELREEDEGYWIIKRGVLPNLVRESRVVIYIYNRVRNSSLDWWV